MKQLNPFSILLFTFVLLLLTPNLTAALLTQEATEIPYQINNSDRIVIGTVSEIHTYDTYTVNTITVKEWLYNPLPAKTINVTNKIGTNSWVEDEAEFTLHEPVLLMLKDSDLNKLLFIVSVGFPGKHPVSDRDAVIEELKAQGKWNGEDAIGNKTSESGITANKGTTGKLEENTTENKTIKTTDTGKAENTVAAGTQGEKSNFTPKSKSAPSISLIWVIAVVFGAVLYTKKRN